MIKKILVLNLILFVNVLTGHCFSENELTNIELSRYGNSYNNESISERLNRLETDYFGMAQSGDIDSRINMLAGVLGNSRQSAIVNPYDNYYGGTKKRSAIRKIWDNVSSALDTTGYMTGYTPSITSTSYGNSYGNDLMNFMNNGTNYCPYHNRHHQNYHPHYNNNFHPHHHGINNYHPNHYNPYNQGGYRSTYQLPPNVTTRSTVKILKD